MHSLPEEFPSEESVLREFGPLAGRYFLEAFDRTPTGWRLHGRPERWVDIAAEWELGLLAAVGGDFVRRRC